MTDVIAPSPSASAPPAASDVLDRQTLIVAGVVMLGAVMSILDTTVVNVAIDHLATVFHSSLTTIQWVITGYTLSLATVIPASGWAADRFGTGRFDLSTASGSSDMDSGNARRNQDPSHRHQRGSSRSRFHSCSTMTSV